jgi:hypothetical protein
MEKTYKVQMYDCHYPNHEFPGQMHRLYTSLELIDFVNNTLREKADTISDACRVINCSNGYVNEVIVEFTNEDFIGNIKPDGTMTKRLDLGSFALDVSRSEDLVANFDKLSIEQQKVICAFIDKAEQVLDQINKQFDKTTSYALINKKAKDILKDFVHDMFISDDRPNPDAQIMNMLKFNGIDIETLFYFLADTVNDMSVADLMTDDFGTLSMYTDKFWHKIVVEAAHNS